MSKKEYPVFATGNSIDRGRDEIFKSSDFSIKVPSLNFPKGSMQLSDIGEFIFANPITGICSVIDQSQPSLGFIISFS